MKRRASRNTNKPSYTELLGEAMDGKRYTLDGISGTIRLKTYRATYPYEHRVVHIYHEPDAHGKRTEQYQKLRRQLRDDWSTELTNSDRLVDIALKLGVDVDKALREAR